MVEVSFVDWAEHMYNRVFPLGVNKFLEEDLARAIDSWRLERFLETKHEIVFPERTEHHVNVSVPNPSISFTINRNVFDNLKGLFSFVFWRLLFAFVFILFGVVIALRVVL